MKKRIGIDARFMIGSKRGIGNYTNSLIKNIISIDKENTYYLYVNKKLQDDELENFKANNIFVRVIPISNYFIFEQILLPIYVLRDSIDLLQPYVH